MIGKYIKVNIRKAILLLATGMGISQDLTPRCTVASSLKTANKQLTTSNFTCAKLIGILYHTGPAVIAVLEASRPRCLRLARRVSAQAIFGGILLIFTSLFTIEGVAQIVPTAPLNLTATAGDGQITLSWTASTSGPISRYEYSSNGGSIWTSTGSTDTNYTVTSLTNGTSYTFTVRGRNSFIPGAASDSVSATPTIPAPTGLTLTAGDGEVTLSWTAPSVSTITGYQYKRDSEDWASSGTASPHTVRNLTNGTSYTFRVRAYGAGGAGTASDSVSAIPRSATPTPQTPEHTQFPSANTLPLLETNPVTYETLTVKRVGNPTVTLSWNIPTPFNSQTILEYHYSMDAGQTWTPTSNTDTSITINGDHATTLPRNRFKVRAISLNAEGTARLVIFVLSPYRIYECPVGWVRSDRFGGPTQRVLIYEVNLEMDMSNLISIYKPVWVAIYVHPDEGLQNLEGWKLQVAVPYNHHREYLLTTENSVVVDAGFVEGGFAFIENPEENPFPMIGMGFTGATVPGFDYRLYDDSGRKVDFGIACYKRGGIFQALKDMEDPRVLRNVLLESLDWDAATYIRSEWTVPAPAPAAPSLVKKTIVGTWANLKKQ